MSETLLSNEKESTDMRWLARHLAAALISKPEWGDDRARVSVFALDAEDAKKAVEQTLGSDAVVETLIFHDDVLNAAKAASGRDGFWVSAQSGLEMFVEADSQEQALELFKAQSGQEPIGWASSEQVLVELTKMGQTLDGTDPQFIASSALLAQVAALQKA